MAGCWSATLLEIPQPPPRRLSDVVLPAEVFCALNVVPRDPNWDLKRDLEPRAEVLRKRTQRAIVEILRERLKAEARQ